MRIEWKVTYDMSSELGNGGLTTVRRLEDPGRIEIDMFTLWSHGNAFMFPHGAPALEYAGSMADCGCASTRDSADSLKDQTYLSSEIWNL